MIYTKQQLDDVRATWRRHLEQRKVTLRAENERDVWEIIQARANECQTWAEVAATVATFTAAAFGDLHDGALCMAWLAQAFLHETPRDHTTEAMQATLRTMIDDRTPRRRVRRSDA